MLTRQGANLVHVDQVSLRIDLVGDEVVVLAAEVDRRPVRQVATLVERQPHHRVPAL